MRKGYICVMGLTLLLLGLMRIHLASEAHAMGKGYPNDHLLLTATQLHGLIQNQANAEAIIVDVREDRVLDGKFLPGAVHMPWTLFHEPVPARNMGGVFVGTAEAQNILGRHGVGREDLIILHDSVARDGGATAAYVFWVLDLLGHERVALLERGIEAWAEAGLPLASRPVKPKPRTYRAPQEEIRPERLADEEFILSRLDDPTLRILDVRSPEEYLGSKITTALDGTPLKPGHIPGAINVNYTLNWIDEQTKAIKPYDELRRLYPELDPRKPVIVYCHSGRRSAFSYFILRLMGFSDAILYDNSWMGWGQPAARFPVEVGKPVKEPNSPGGAIRPSARAQLGGAVGCDGTGQAVPASIR